MNYVLRVGSQTDQGQVYDHNEDSVFTRVRSTEDQVAALLIVADGVGGHKAGEVASKIVIDTIVDDFDSFLSSSPENQSRDNPDIDELEKNLIAAIEDANQAIHQYSDDNETDAGNLGSTVTAALLVGDTAIVANVGDSRTYYYHDGRFEQVSIDHSLVGEMVRKGIVQPEEIYTHPHRSVITRALGNEPEVEVDTFRINLKPGNRILLCSDGMWEMIQSSAEISETLYGDNDLSIVADNLVKKANEYGGKDNIGVVVAEFKEA